MVNTICRRRIQVLIGTVTLAVVGRIYFENASIKLTSSPGSKEEGIGIGIGIGTIESKSKPKSESESESESKSKSKRSYTHDFTYHRERWKKNSPCIAVLAGPHKTASTTLQTFI